MILLICLGFYRQKLLHEIDTANQITQEIVIENEAIKKVLEETKELLSYSQATKQSLEADLKARQIEIMSINYNVNNTFDKLKEKITIWKQN